MTLSSLKQKHPAIRLGFRQAKGIGAKEIARLLAARGAGYRSAEQLWRRAELEARTLGQLANADAFRSIGLDRRQALWTVRGLGEKPLPWGIPDAIQNMRVLDAIFESERSGGWVNV